MNTAQHTGVIYMLTNQITDERYIGRTTDFARRMRDYKGGHGHGDIGKFIAKHGWNNFAVVELENDISDIDLPSREDYYITKLDPEINLMTSTAGGRMRHAESTKRKMSVAHCGKKVSPETRAKISASTKGKTSHLLGRKLSPEHCAKLSEAMRGKKHSLETRAKMSKAQRGKPKPPMSSEHRAKISAAKRGKKHSPETKAKISASNKGKPKSPEHRAKISATMRAK